MTHYQSEFKGMRSAKDQSFPSVEISYTLLQKYLIFQKTFKIFF